jgi:nucleoside-diphosphate-sugar epimerase
LIKIKYYRKAAFIPDAVGHRHILVSSNTTISMKQWADILNEEFGPKGYKIPTELDNGKTLFAKIDDSRMRNVLGISPRDFKSTVIDMANSIIENKLV